MTFVRSVKSSDKQRYLFRKKITNIIFFADFINKFYFSLASNVIILQNKENAGNEKQLTIKREHAGLVLKHHNTKQLQEL